MELTNQDVRLDVMFIASPSIRKIKHNQSSNFQSTYSQHSRYTRTSNSFETNRRFNFAGQKCAIQYWLYYQTVNIETKFIRI